ncbi:16S rRNA (uracil(1498)-N(3))-methyltransferase [Aliikangiella marina]|uniref:Ribosomal RNA small subunit methyltransferase E n=1 Tax=Aliikangiella marina TaxID=1712262 RepID=A0A545TAA4_9GAMM|nr:16S rRNA (uracil(1498)-N(3))-methyltransferase [Aliikangiella marina]TQV74146.1 16S rRNA (uracil(1498)-N(3))-methyltransferase [Aliikangiella marina]
MRIHRFYAPITLAVRNELPLPKEASHHCIQVLRYSVGDSLILFNGDGFDYIAEITAIEKKSCAVTITEKINLENESPINIHLFQGIARGDKMDLIIQKSVELGVKYFTPIFTERSNVKLDNKRQEKKLVHWQNIAISACEQSGRAIVPKINPPVQIKNLPGDENTLHLILEPTATSRITDLPKTKNIAVYIGPEGGFSPSDLDKLKSIGALGIRLGPRVLRTETAGLATIAILQTTFGDLS